ncbi:PD-(D/E)XK nuclease family protein [Conexibacter sp. CPCC 206217]|uniref:PD-(D/E)XK nuclease family protein n=1 Tax=Conexibacter sp. CPCC 206217 TaxID=3064574 RepID=UPI002727FF2D|nr:PD-(D/E)XK nuclease family protein [Conexibacter sp. CPCC 206217]MDO8208965.1 PD-(D/E)XK nuclease family protein [Conexibacter sp. CPCC 206217]
MSAAAVTASASVRPPAFDVGVPVRLPARADGRRMHTLSASSYELWQQCEERWRRRYLLGEREPPSPAMMLGTAVDRALGWMYERRIEGELPERGDVLVAYARLYEENERDRRSAVWTAAEPEQLIRAWGLRCVEVFLDRIAPLVGRAVSVQRELTLKLNDACEWKIRGYVDLETIRDEPVAVTDHGLVLAIDAAPPKDHTVVTRCEAGEPIVTDYKVKSRYITRQEADGDLQAGLYLLDRRLRGDPAGGFVFANLIKPGGRRAAIDGRLLLTTRTERQMRGVLDRFAQMASEITARVEQFGFERPWKFADPRQSFPCRQRFCAYAQRCPGWSGL